MAWAMRRTVCMTTLVILAGSLSVSACSPEEDPVDHPDGSVAVVVNQPTTVAGQRVIAYNVRDETVIVDVTGDTGDIESERVTVGDETTLAGLTFTVVAIDSDDSDQPPGGDMTTVWFLAS